MRVMGLDVGTVTVGIAISDLLGFSAQPLETFRFPSEQYKTAIQHIASLVEKHGVERIVIGLPKNMNGSIGPSGERSKQFKEALVKVVDIPLILWDERLTTVQAERILLEADTSRKKRKKVIDTMAATLILDNYLQSI